MYKETHNKSGKNVSIIQRAHKGRKLLFGITAVCTMALTMLAGCGNNEKTDTAYGEKKEKVEVNIGYFPNVTHAQALVMKNEGTLEEAFGEDASVNWTSFNAGPAEVEAIFAGDIDIGYIGPVPAINANVKSDGDVRILTGATQAGSIMIKRADSDIESVADLAGKNVAIPQMGNTQHLCLLALLEENGLKPVTDGGTVNVAAVANADVGNMLAQGNIDAALVPEPWGATLLDQGAELLLDENQVFMEGDYSVAVVVVRKEFEEAHPEIVEAFLKAHDEATEAINDNLNEKTQVMNEEIYNATSKKLDEALLTEAFSRIKVDSAINKASIDRFVEIGLSQNFISEKPKDNLLDEK